MSGFYRLQKLFAGFLLLYVLLLAGVINGQTTPASSPLILNLAVQEPTRISWDIYTWDEASASLTRRSTWGYNRDLVLSPTGDQIAYSSTAAVSVEAIERVGGFGGCCSFTNVWVMNPRTGDGYRIADQPPDAAFLTEDLADKGIIRSVPVYSPDGSQIAWTEFDHASEYGDSLRLMVHDLSSGVTQIVVDGLPVIAPIGQPAAVWWMDSGIVVDRVECGDSMGCQFIEGFFIYATDGTRVNEVILREGANSEEPRAQHIQPVRYQERDYMALFYEDTGWKLLDILTGDITDAPASPEASSGLQTSETGIRFGYDEEGNIQVYHSSGSLLDIPLTDSDQRVVLHAISPEGDALAYSLRTSSSGGLHDNLYLWRDGKVTEIISASDSLRVSQVLWSPLEWVIPE